MNNLISVIIPVYNVEQYLSKCLDSVVNQTYKNLEVILVDDGSTDNSGKICDEFALKDNRIIVIHKSNGGLSSARNEGLKFAKGQYVGFVDSDDYIEIGMYEKLLEVSLKYGSDVVCSNYYRVTNNKIYYKKILKGKNILAEISNNKGLEMGFDNLPFHACDKLFERSLFNNLSFPEGQLFEDISTISKIFMEAKKIVIYDKPLYYYNMMNLSSLTKQSFNIRKLDYFKATGNILEYAISNKNFSLAKAIKRERAYHISGFLRQMIESNFNDEKIINIYIKELRKNIFLHLLSKHKLSNKLFAMVACIKFNIAKKIYKVLKK